VLCRFGEAQQIIASMEQRPMARLLKFLRLFVAGVAILHKLQPLLGIELF
jgi:hypothetical protein